VTRQGPGKQYDTTINKVRVDALRTSRKVLRNKAPAKIRRNVKKVFHAGSNRVFVKNEKK